MTNSPTIKEVAIPYGLFMALYSIVVLVLIYVFNIERENWVVAVINALISIAIFVFAIKQYKKKNAGFISLSQALKVGMGVAVISGLIAGIYSFIHYTYVYPEFTEMIYDEAVLSMEEKNVPASQMEKALEITSYTTSPLFFATMTLVSSLFFGFLISLITGLVVKRQDPNQ